MPFFYYFGFMLLGLFAVPIIVLVVLIFMQFFVSSMDQIEGATPFLEKPPTLTCFHCGKETVANRKTCRHCGGELQ